MLKTHLPNGNPSKMTSRCRYWLCLFIWATPYVHNNSISSFTESSLGRNKINLVDETCSEEGRCDSCTDIFEMCDIWASHGDCEYYPKYMLKNCQKSCHICGGNFTESYFDMGVEQTIDSKRAEEVKERLNAAQDYLKNVVLKDPNLRPLLEGCKLNHENCAFWAAVGECENNPGYMTLNCAPVCQSCDQLSIKTRCPIDLEKMPNAWKPGDVNEFFTNLTTTEKYAQYEPRVLSRPSLLPGDTEEMIGYLVGGPWAVLLENFLSDEEAERLIELGAAEGYERSSDVGKAKFDGTYDSHIGGGRTSHNSWCVGECYNDAIAHRVIQRITDLTNIPEENSENLQMLRYEVGEYYQTHHDYIEYQMERQAGVRIMTVYMYLNDVEEGGGTQFPHLGLTVQPKRGHAVIWPSVLDEAPDEMDDRTEHQALPVIKGVKYGANAWIHQRDFKTPNKNGC